MNHSQDNAPESRSRALRVLFAGGASGGHLMPGAAVAEALTEMLPGCRCLFLKTDRKVEDQCVAALERFEVAVVPSTPWAGAVQKACFPFRSLRSAEQILGVLRQFRPHVVVGLGSYNSVVPVLLARVLRIRTALFESNAVAGLAVRTLAPLADCLFLQWEAARRNVHARRVRVLGNPIRARLFDTERTASRRRLGLSQDTPVLLAMGGSQGAQAVNRLLFDALEILSADGVDLQVLHLTGVDHLPEALDAQRRLTVKYRAIGFLERIEEAYAAADFVLSRAGGSSLSYITAAGLPSILVPYPHHADKQQYANAHVLSDTGAAVQVEQRRLSGERLAALIRLLAVNPGLRAQMAGHARALARPHAARQVARELAALAGFHATEQSTARDYSKRRIQPSQAA